jgi:hypothetical protein
MRALVKEILARRMPEAPEDYAALQISRLNEALAVAYSAMSPQNLKAVALVVRIVRELDRYHGFVPAARRPRRAPAEAMAEAQDAVQTAFDEASSPAAAAPPVAGPQLTPQAIEMSESAPENGPLPTAREKALPASVRPQETARSDASDRAAPPPAGAEEFSPAALATPPRGAFPLEIRPIAHSVSPLEKDGPGRRRGCGPRGRRSRAPRAPA